MYGLKQDIYKVMRVKGQKMMKNARRDWRSSHDHDFAHNQKSLWIRVFLALPS